MLLVPSVQGAFEAVAVVIVVVDMGLVSSLSESDVLMLGDDGTDIVDVVLVDRGCCCDFCEPGTKPTSAPVRWFWLNRTGYE